jgi:hypothetical protein
MGHGLKQLSQDADGLWHLTASHDGGESVIAARHIISSAPMRELAGRIHPCPSACLTPWS